MKIEPKKKVAILYSGGKYFGGIEQYLLNLFEHIDKDGIEFELLSLGEWPLTERLRDKGYLVVGFSAGRINFMTIAAIGRYLRENNFGLLVSQGVVANAYARLVSFIYGVPNLVTAHSDLVGDYSNLVIRSIYWLVDRVLRFATCKYIVVSKFLKNKLVDSGVAGDKISVIYNGVKLPKLSYKSHDGIVIGSVGRLHQVKGYDLLIRAFASIDYENVSLKIAGDGPELERLRSLASDLDVDDRVEFVGFQDDVDDFLNGIDVYVQSSRNEGFGLAVVEAMALGLPVVATPVGSMAEIIEDGKTGFVCEQVSSESLADNISKVVHDYSLLDKIRKDARAFVKNRFDINLWAKDTEEAYKEAMK